MTRAGTRERFRVRSWSQTVDLPPLIGEVLALVRSARLSMTPKDNRRVWWVQ